jgi:hypothetical protein
MIHLAVVVVAEVYYNPLLQYPPLHNILLLLAQAGRAHFFSLVIIVQVQMVVIPRYLAVLFQLMPWVGAQVELVERIAAHLGDNLGGRAEERHQQLTMVHRVAL